MRRYSIWTKSSQQTRRNLLQRKRCRFSVYMMVTEVSRFGEIRTTPHSIASVGSTVARFAGDTVHHRLAGIEDYKNKKYEAALKRAFISTDEDLRSSTASQLL